MNLVPLTYDSFKKVMTLTTYLEDCSSAIIRMLNEAPSKSESYLHQTNYYKGILVGIRNRAQKIRTEWINAAAELDMFFEIIETFNLTYEKIQKDFRELNELIEYIFEVDYLIDTRGKLIKKIRARR